MNDLNKHTHLKETTSGGDQKRLSRRPMWRSLKMATNVGVSIAPSNNITTRSTTTRNHPLQPDITKEDTSSITDETSRLSTWLTQQFHDYEEQALYSPSWIDEREISTMSNLSLVSHVSSINNTLSTADRSIKKRPSSVPSSPTTPRILLKQVETTIPAPNISSMNNNNSAPPLSPPLEDKRYSFNTLALPTTLSNNQQDEIDHQHTNKDSEDEEDDDTYETASGSKSYSEYMDDRLDEINDNSSASLYYINPYDDTFDDDDLADHHYSIPADDNDTCCLSNSYKEDNDSNDEEYGRNNIKGGMKNRTSSTQALYVNSVLDSMDPEVAQALLEWRRQSLLKVDWFDMFAVKSELWRSSSLFHLYPNQDCQSSSKSSIATSIITLDYQGVSLDKAFRSYSSKIDYAKSSVLDIDQALQIFSQLYWECNPSKLFRCAELVYIVIHSLLLLNTDVHAGQEHATMDDFCTNTIKLILGHQTSIPIMLYDEGGESTWLQSMVDCLQSLYRSVKKSSLLSMEQQRITSVIIDHHQHHQQQQSYIEESRPDIPLETAFDDLFISTPRETSVTPTAPERSTSTPQKKSKRNRRSNSLHSTPSWTLLRRRDTLRAKVGPYKEGPLSCKLNGEEWKICWVILHHGYLHIYHHHDSGNSAPLSILGAHTTTTASISSSPNSVSSETNKNNKIKKKFMQHLTHSPTIINTATITSNNNNGHLSYKKEPYEEVDIHLGNTFCEKLRPHVFLLQMMNGNTYVFDCGSESQAAIWIRDCNYWAARETKIVLPRAGFIRASLLDTNYSSFWKRPPPPAGASVLDKKGQQEAIDTYLDYLQNELEFHLQQPGHANDAWQDKKMYLEIEVRKYQCYQNSIYKQ
ncbi:hypothetical protein BC941DRAFT_423380 [Chlamydoabsidia padenii]|nr:hypothetical protein BC941DRAFT_423380 [Chlamydoabsidia padenii]